MTRLLFIFNIVCMCIQLYRRYVQLHTQQFNLSILCIYYCFFSINVVFMFAKLYSYPGSFTLIASQTYGILCARGCGRRVSCRHWSFSRRRGWNIAVFKCGRITTNLLIDIWFRKEWPFWICANETTIHLLSGRLCQYLHFLMGCTHSTWHVNSCN